MKYLSRYDRMLCITSLYILIPSYYSNKYIFIIMNFQTLFSLLHWYKYNNKIYHKLDVYTSSFIFIYHIFLIKNKITFILCILSLLSFINKNGYREKIIKNKNLKYIYILPHTLFRFISFWYIMYCYNLKFNLILSITYWSNIFILINVF